MPPVFRGPVAFRVPVSEGYADEGPEVVKPIDRDILRAVALRWDTDDPRWPNEILDKPDRLIERRMLALTDRGYLEYGVSVRTAWLTEKGRAEL